MGSHMLAQFAVTAYSLLTPGQRQWWAAFAADNGCSDGRRSLECGLVIRHSTYMRCMRRGDWVDIVLVCSLQFMFGRADYGNFVQSVHVVCG